MGNLRKRIKGRLINNAKGYKKYVTTITHKVSETNSSVHGNSAHGKSLISNFQQFFSSINKIFIWTRRLSTRLLFLSRSATREATRIYHVYR